MTTTGTSEHRGSPRNLFPAITRRASVAAGLHIVARRRQAARAATDQSNIQRSDRVSVCLEHQVDGLPVAALVGTTMMTIDHDDLTNVTGGQQLARRTSALDSPTFVPPGLRPDQITTEQFKADLHARVNIRFSADAAAEIRQARPWVTPEQASDPEYIKGFMVPWY